MLHDHTNTDSIVRNRQVATESEHARIASPHSLLGVVLLPALSQVADETHSGPLRRSRRLDAAGLSQGGHGVGEDAGLAVLLRPLRTARCCSVRVLCAPAEVRGRARHHHRHHPHRPLPRDDFLI